MLALVERRNACFALLPKRPTVAGREIAEPMRDAQSSN